MCASVPVRARLTRSHVSESNANCARHAVISLTTSGTCWSYACLDQYGPHAIRRVAIVMARLPSVLRWVVANLHRTTVHADDRSADQHHFWAGPSSCCHSIDTGQQNECVRPNDCTLGTAAALPHSQQPQAGDHGPYQYQSERSCSQFLW